MSLRHREVLDPPYRESQAGNISPERASAYRKLHNAVKAGRIEPRPCWRCGTDRSVVAHQENWGGEPLDVRWFCRSCLARDLALRRRNQPSSERM
jgi:hypothetical protein